MTFSPPPTEVQRPEGGEEVPEHAQAPDDDSRWKMGVLGDGTTTPEGQIQLCEARLKRVMQTERPRTLISAILGGGCTALKGEDCARCRICPAGMSNVTGYYRANKQNITICAEKLPSEREIERTLTHELIHAYDHCRKSMRVPFVGRQAPWALTCPTVACSEVRAYLLGDHWEPALGGGGGGGGGGGFGSGGGGGWGSSNDGEIGDTFAPPSANVDDTSTPEARCRRDERLSSTEHAA